MSSPRSAFVPSIRLVKTTTIPVGGDTTSVSLPIDGEIYHMLIIKMRAVNNTAGGAIYMVRPNGISTGYGYERIYGNTTTPTSNQNSTYTGIIITGARAGEVGYGSVTTDLRSGTERFAESNYVYGVVGTALQYSFWQHSIWNDSTTAVTSLEIVSSYALGISAGSRIDIYGVST